MPKHPHGRRYVGHRVLRDQDTRPAVRALLPVVNKATENVGLTQKYNAFAGKAASFGLLKPEESNLAGYVTGKDARRPVLHDWRGRTQDSPEPGRRRQRRVAARVRGPTVSRTPAVPSAACPCGRLQGSGAKAKPWPMPTAAAVLSTTGMPSPRPTPNASCVRATPPLCARRPDYLLATWHPSHRPRRSTLTPPPNGWAWKCAATG